MFKACAYVIVGNLLCRRNGPGYPEAGRTAPRPCLLQLSYEAQGVLSEHHRGVHAKVHWEFLGDEALSEEIDYLAVCILELSA